MQHLKAIDMAKCIGCYSCVLACARLVHKTLSWERSGIHIRSAGGLSTGFEAIYCLACDPPPCAAVCPTEALKPKPGGGVIFRSNLCMGCGKCVQACTVGAIHFDGELNKPIVCVHCGRCVSFCPHGCITLVKTGKKQDEK
ncbi:MAG: 4Fe-4S binding protein [Desulfonauticus sp.]|nr:4Fe-4S binding protein [Desulfonauticus sp.]